MKMRCSGLRIDAFAIGDMPYPRTSLIGTKRAKCDLSSKSRVSVAEAIVGNDGSRRWPLELWRFL